MEEKKDVLEKGNTPDNKFTYEQLESIAANLSSQVQQLGAKLQEANMYNTFKMLDYYFKVLEVFPTIKGEYKEFIDKCTKEIVSIMSQGEETE